MGGLASEAGAKELLRILGKKKAEAGTRLLLGRLGVRREECRCCCRCAAVREPFNLAWVVRAVGRRKSVQGPGGDLSAR